MPPLALPPQAALQMLPPPPRSTSVLPTAPTALERRLERGAPRPSLSTSSHSRGPNSAGWTAGWTAGGTPGPFPPWTVQNAVPWESFIPGSRTRLCTRKLTIKVISHPTLPSPTHRQTPRNRSGAPVSLESPGRAAEGPEPQADRQSWPAGQRTLPEEPAGGGVARGTQRKGRGFHLRPWCWENHNHPLFQGWVSHRHKAGWSGEGRQWQEREFWKGTAWLRADGLFVKTSKGLLGSPLQLEAKLRPQSRTRG